MTSVLHSTGVAAGDRVLLQHSRPDAVLSQFIGGCEPSRTRADNDYWCSLWVPDGRRHVYTARNPGVHTPWIDAVRGIL